MSQFLLEVQKQNQLDQFTKVNIKKHMYRIYNQAVLFIIFSVEQFMMGAFSCFSNMQIAKFIINLFVIINLIMNESLLTNYSHYQQQYQSKCNEWRSEPVSNRTCNDIGCIFAFFVMLGFFIGVGAFYIHQKGSVIDVNKLYVTKHGGQIAGCMGIAVVLSFIYIILIKLMPKVMVYLLMVLSLILLLGIGITRLIAGQSSFALPFLITFAIYALVLFCWRKKIGLGIVLIKVASRFLSDKWGVFISPIIKVIFNIFFSVFWIYSLSCIILVSNDKADKKQDNAKEVVFAILWFFIWFFFNFIFYYIMVFTIAVACSFWYYKVEGRNYLLTAYQWIFTSSFGTIVFGSFLIAIVSFARLIVGSQPRSSKGIAAGLCLCILSFCLQSVQTLLFVFNHNCLIVTSVTGESYMNSAKTAVGILSRFFGLVSVSNIITGLLVFWGVVIVASAVWIISNSWLAGEGTSLLELFIVLLVTVLGAIMVSSLIFSVLVQAVSSVLVFYCFDVKFREMGYSSNNMPVQISQALGNHNY